MRSSITPRHRERAHGLFVDCRHFFRLGYFYRYGRHEIWGLTGRILKHFLDFVWKSV
jgi:hypothetical protein